ncbi:HAD family hydrolase [Spirillospora sp. NPDC047279]|uniref:HAD family hydrolase n=1 Tax=Spirillospora sp. NPDC047279 TaxID=3155478 RepID=UPI0033C64AFC
MIPLVCSDLDRTLIYSVNSMALAGPDAGLPRLLCVELYQAAPLSYVTETAARGLELLAAGATFVPTTTRTIEQYARVHLLEKPPAYAICANGGHILVDGVEDREWSAAVRARIAGGGRAELAEVHEHLRGAGGEFMLKLRTAAGLFAYAVVDRAALPAGWTADLTGWCAERGWRVSLQGRKVYCLPETLTKADAAAEVARRTGATATLAAGDSLLDIELLEFADAAIRPAHGELHDTGWSSPRTAVTAAHGIAAGEEIVGWLLERAAGTGA